MDVRRTGWVAVCAALVLAGCTTLPADPDYAGPEALPAEVAADFAYAPVRPWITHNEVLTRNWWFEIERVRFKSAVSLLPGDAERGGHEVVLDYYKPRGKSGRRAAVMVLPILGGAYEAAKYFAGWFALHGYAAVIVRKNDEHHDPDSLESMNAVFKQLVLDHRQALDWMATEPGIDEDRVGVFGISAGAIKGSLVYAVDRRIKAALLALPAGDVPYVLSFSDDRGVKRRREKALASQKLTVEQLHEALRKDFRYDPLTYAKYADARHVLMILAERDEVVFYEKGLELREAMGRPKAIVLPSGHYSAVVFTPFIQGAAVKFFEAELGEPVAE